jgi:hypothetical protein
MTLLSNPMTTAHRRISSQAVEDVGGALDIVFRVIQGMQRAPGARVHQVVRALPDRHLAPGVDLFIPAIWAKAVNNLPSPMLILFEPTKATFLILPSDEIFFKLSAIPFISTVEIFTPVARVKSHRGCFTLLTGHVLRRLQDNLVGRHIPGNPEKGAAVFGFQ